MPSKPTSSSTPPSYQVPSIRDAKGNLKVLPAQVDEFWRYQLDYHGLDVPSTAGIRPSELEPFAVMVPPTSDKTDVRQETEMIKLCLGSVVLEIRDKTVRGKKVHYANVVFSPYIQAHGGMRSFEGPWAVTRIRLWSAYALLCAWVQGIMFQKTTVPFHKFLDHGMVGTPPNRDMLLGLHDTDFLFPCLPRVAAVKYPALVAHGSKPHSKAPASQAKPAARKEPTTIEEFRNFLVQKEISNLTMIKQELFRFWTSFLGQDKIREDLEQNARLVAVAALSRQKNAPIANKLIRDVEELQDELIDFAEKLFPKSGLNPKAEVFETESPRLQKTSGQKKAPAATANRFALLEKLEGKWSEIVEEAARDDGSTTASPDADTQIQEVPDDEGGASHQPSSPDADKGHKKKPKLQRSMKKVMVPLGSHDNSPERS